VTLLVCQGSSISVRDEFEVITTGRMPASGLFWRLFLLNRLGWPSRLRWSGGRRSWKPARHESC
jgi:hypothetical protein